MEIMVTKTGRSSHWSCSVKKMFLKVLKNSQKNTCVGACNFVKIETTTQMFPVNFPKFIRTTSGSELDVHEVSFCSTRYDFL